MLDRTVHAVETGTIPKTDVVLALEGMFKVGEPGGKTRERFDALIQALDADEAGPMLNYKTVFEEDREYNQGMIVYSVLTIRQQAVSWLSHGEWLGQHNRVVADKVTTPKYVVSLSLNKSLSCAIVFKQVNQSCKAYIKTRLDHQLGPNSVELHLSSIEQLAIQLKMREPS